MKSTLLKISLGLLFGLSLNRLHSQSVFPEFLNGTWKIENEEHFEHWDKMNSEQLKGVTYKLIQGRVIVEEYSEIVKSPKGIVYKASPVGQNNGKTIEFKQTRSDSLFVFENPKHDFPKKIIYKLINAKQVEVSISDGAKKTISYKMVKQL
jgi:hypothetical protein